MILIYENMEQESKNNHWILSPLHSDEIEYGKRLQQINSIIVHLTNNYVLEPNANLIFFNIWLGNLNSAYDQNFINQNKIKSIINVCDKIPNIFSLVQYVNYPLTDKNACYHQLLDIFNQCAEIIHQSVVRNETILVHCKKGHHRSAAIVAYYLMKYQKMKLDYIIKLIKKNRPAAFRRMTCMLYFLIKYDFITQDFPEPYY